jgi:hypothetical protein
MADFLAKQIKEPTVLLPAPQHTGEAEYTLEIAEMIQKKLGPNMVSVCNALVCDPHETMYDQKRSLVAGSANPLSAEQISSLDAGNMRWREHAAQIFGKYIHWKHCLLDNVISTGRTFEEARKLVPDIEPLVFAASPLYLKDRAFEPATEKEIADAAKGARPEENRGSGEELTCDNFSEKLSEERRKRAGEDIMAVAGRLVERMKDPKELEKFRKICERKGVRCPEDLKRLFDDISSGKDSFEIKPESQKRQKPAQRGTEM